MNKITLDTLNNSLPLVSIFAICHKHGPYVIETLESIRNQTYSNIQIIVINNIKDECNELIKNWIHNNNFSHPPIFIQNEVPLGLTQNCKLGLSKVTGKYFQGISCDDIMLSEKIEHQVRLFETLDESYAVIHGNVINIDEQGRILENPTKYESFKNKFNVSLDSDFDQKKILGWTVLIQAPSVLIRTEAVNSVGGYDDYPWEDYQLWAKLAYNNYKIKYLNEILIKYRILTNSISRRKTSKIDQFNIDKMFLDIYFKYSDMFADDYWTRVRFTRKFNSLWLDKKVFLDYSIKFIHKKSLSSKIIILINIWLLYPFAKLLNIHTYLFKVQDLFYKKIFQSST